MPYDFHLAETEHEARSSVPDLSLDYNVHQEIFRVDFHDLILFYNLSDFYQDASFMGSVLINLRAEVQEARKRVHATRGTDALSQLSKLCERGIKRRLNLFAFSE